jgi:hypothetical protein
VLASAAPTPTAMIVIAAKTTKWERPRSFMACLL